MTERKSSEKEKIFLDEEIENISTGELLVKAFEDGTEEEYYGHERVDLEILNIITNLKEELPDDEFPKWYDDIRDRIYNIIKEEREGYIPGLGFSKCGDFTDTDIQKLKNKAGYGQWYSQDNTPDGAVIYALKCVREEDDKVFYYVGSVTGQSLGSRVSQHKAYGGDFLTPKKYKNREILVDAEEVYLDVELIHEKEIERDNDLSDDEFRRVVLYEEMVASHKVAKKKGTDKVLGTR